LDQTDIAIDFSYKVQIDEQTNMYCGLKAAGGFTSIDSTRANAQAVNLLFAQNQSFFNPHLGVGMNYRIEESTSLYRLIREIENLRFGAAYDMSTADASNINDNRSLEFIVKYQV